MRCPAKLSASENCVLCRVTVNTLNPLRMLLQKPVSSATSLSSLVFRRAPSLESSSQSITTSIITVKLTSSTEPRLVVRSRSVRTSAFSVSSLVDIEIHLVLLSISQHICLCSHNLQATLSVPLPPHFYGGQGSPTVNNGSSRS